MITGVILAFMLSSPWAIVVGAAMLVCGGIILAILVEPMLDQAATTSDEVADTVEPPDGMAA